MRRLCYCDVEIPLLLPKAALLAYQSQVRGEKKRRGRKRSCGSEGWRKGERKQGRDRERENAYACVHAEIVLL